MDYLVVFLIPCAIVLVSLYLLGMFPFGDRTLSVWDLQITYTYFYQWFQRVLAGDGNIFYSFSKSLGGNMYSTFALFMTSPISWLSILFAGHNIMDFVTFSITVRFGLAGVTALHYLRHRFALARPFTIMLAICYAMMLFMTTQSANPMWMDVVIILPLVLLGIHRVIGEGKTTLFFVSVLLCILIDWYNGYMVCLFSVLFYLFESVSFAPRARELGKRVRLRILVNPGRFIVVLLLAAFASAVVLLPTALGLLGGKGAVPGGLFSFALRYDFTDVFRSAFLGVYEKEYLPQLYCGTLALICSLSYLANRDIPRRERIAAAALLVFMVLCTWYAPADRIWCGFRDGNSFYCRYTFLISAILIFTAARTLETISRKSYPVLILAAGIVIVGACITFVQGDFPRLRYFAVTLLSSVTLTAGIILWKRFEAEGRTVARVVVAVLMVLVVSGEALVSCHGILRYRLNADNRSSYERYSTYYSEGALQYEQLDSEDGTSVDAYRVNKLYSFLSPYRRIASNEGLVYGYSQIGQYDSAYDDRVQNMMSYLGYSGNWNCITTYNDPVLVSDSLLGVRYVASKSCPNGFIDVALDDTQDGNRFFENPYALPLGYGASTDIVDDAITHESKEDDPYKDPFVYQNAFVSDLLGTDTQCFTKLKAEQVARTSDEIIWQVTVPANTYVYGYIAGNPWLSLDLYEDDEYRYIYMDQWSHGIFPFTVSDTDRTVTISLRVHEDESPSTADSIGDEQILTLSAYALDMDTFTNAMSELNAHPFQIDTFEDGHVHGTYTSDEDGLMFTTIPYDAGWTVKVNGERVVPQIAQDTFLCVPVTAGENDIEMTYISPGFIPGLLVTLAAILLFVIFACAWSRRDRRRALASMQTGPERRPEPELDMILSETVGAVDTADDDVEDADLGKRARSSDGASLEEAGLTEGTDDTSDRVEGPTGTEGDTHG